MCKFDDFLQIRLRQEAILEEETTKRLELEKIKKLQEEYLEQERITREVLEKLSKEQAEKLELVSKFVVQSLLSTMTQSKIKFKYPEILVIPLNYVIESHCVTFS